MRLTLLLVIVLAAAATTAVLADARDSDEEGPGGPGGKPGGPTGQPVAPGQQWTLRVDPTLVLQGVVQDGVLTLKATLAGTAWVGIGFSPKGKMSGAYAVVAREGLAVEVYMSGEAVEDIKQTVPSLIFNQSLVQAGGVTHLNFSRKLDAGAARPVLAANAPTGLIWAYGRSNVFEQHLHSGAFNVRLNTGEVVPPMRPTVLIVLHAVFMWIAWGALNPVGAIISASACARRREPTSGKRAWWFLRHHILQSTGSLVAVIAWILAFVQVQLRSQPHAEGLHGIAGYVILGLMVFQVAAGFMRTRETSRGYTHWAWMHRIIGWLLSLAAILEMILGLAMIQAIGFLIAVAVAGAIAIAVFVYGRFCTGERPPGVLPTFDGAAVMKAEQSEERPLNAPSA